MGKLNNNSLNYLTSKILLFNCIFDIYDDYGADIASAYTLQSSILLKYLDALTYVN